MLKKEWIKHPNDSKFFMGFGTIVCPVHVFQHSANMISIQYLSIITTIFLYKFSSFFGTRPCFTFAQQPPDSERGWPYTEETVRPKKIKDQI